MSIGKFEKVIIIIDEGEKSMFKDNWLAFLVTYIAGLLTTRIFEIIFDKCFDGLKFEYRKRSANKFQERDFKDILLTASGVPYFDHKNINLSKSKNYLFLLKFPENLRDENLHGNSFSNEDKMPFDLELQDVSQEDFVKKLEESRLTVAMEFINREEGNYFNGDKYGVLHVDGFSRTEDKTENPILNIIFYKTDYFTHKVIGTTLQNLNISKESLTADYLNKNPWMRTSFGLSLIVILSHSNEILLTKRKTTASYSEGKEWIYVSVTEAISDSDYNNMIQKPDFTELVTRGLSEELGIMRDSCRLESIKFYDSFFETSFMQDNIVASVEICDDISFYKISQLMARDKSMEVEELFTIDNNKKAIEDFIKENKDDMRAQTIFSLESYASRL